MSVMPEWMYPPREEGWFAEDLDHLLQAPRHTELIDGALVFMTPRSVGGTVSSSPTWWSRCVVRCRRAAGPGGR